MIRSFLSLYSWNYPRALVYMLQSNEYQAGPYLRWYWHTSNFSAVEYRRELQHTKAARMLLGALRVGIVLEILAGLLLIWLCEWHGLIAGWEFGLALILASPVVWAHLAVVPLELGRVFIVKPKHKRAIKASEKVFRAHKGSIIAIVGSYGKTSMKELLLTVLSGGKKVAATPANKNVAISHAYFAQTLNGDEDITIIEYGEGAPGDVGRFAAVTHPTHAVITGVAPAHLDKYKTVERAADDIFSVTKFVKPGQVYVNGESPAATSHIKKSYNTYNQGGALGWSVSQVQVGLDGTAFTMSKSERSLTLKSSLIGRHQLGPLVLAAALAAEFGLSDVQIKEGIAKTAPFEHRMQPYNLGGAWIIDDTYNGNIEGIRAGTALLAELAATRKIYVTPGLVDQGKEAAAVHHEMGKLIAAANPDIVVLMQNSATAAIKQGLEKGGFTNQLLVEDDPLGFYSNLQAFVAAGDIVLMQNDWTDNYA